MALIRQAEWSEGGREATVLNLGDLKAQALAAQEAAQQHAAGIIAKAMAERQSLLSGAIEEGRATGNQAGFAEGHAKGIEEGRRAASEVMKAALKDIEQRWVAALGDFEHERSKMLADARHDVLTLALEIAERVVKRKVSCDPEVAVAQVEAVLQKMSRPTRLVVCVNPQDEAPVRAALPVLVERLAGGVHSELVIDASIERGSCIARSAGGEIDATISSQMQRIAEAIVPGSGAVVARVEPAEPQDVVGDSAGLEKAA